jgi:murein DD-endopeptidase MepM/ murein hydrolase activator NlpD
MARSFRATSLLLIALGVAVPVLPASAAAANAGGAAPGSEVTSAAPTSSDAVGGAAPGVTPARTARSSGVGGALPGHKPPQPKVVRRPTARRPATTTRPSAPSAPQVPTVAGTFPVQGPFSFGGEDARFGARRAGHIHQGQDVIAASGEPLVAPVAGTVVWKANQPGGAGIYVVVRGADAGLVRDYVFMHIKRGTVLVAPGESVRAGQQLAQVGATGDASGPHLHFELWIGGWYVRGGAPIDPLPQLERWAGLS